MSIPVLSRRLAASFFICAVASVHPAAAQDVSRAADVARSISPDIVISQVYGGGGNAGALYKNDFIELFNRGASPVSIAG